MSAPSRLDLGPRTPLSGLQRVAGVLGYFTTVWRRTWQSTVFSRFVTPIFFLAAMGLGVGQLVDATSGGVGGIPYLQFVVPGMVMASVMQWVHVAGDDPDQVEPDVCRDARHSLGRD